ncbi:unnamed protein product [Rotaria sp. Silwood1]|nr:unnamed protein product [Rotaria sp. Silwood1]CAF1666300.1 unnamed protein product [Rotaria sp. Silwood1]
MLGRFSRSYIKIDGIFADDTRLLIKLIIGLALFSEEIGDQQREDENNELEAQRSYDRALKLCAIIWLDRGFQNEIQQLPTTCLECEWNGSLKLYQKHRDQNHQQFTNCSICNEQVAQSNLHRHYLDEIHQEILSTFSLICTSNNSNLNHSQIQGTISNLLNSTKVRNNDIQRINRELNSHQYAISVMAQQWSSFKTIVQEINDHIYGIEINRNLLYQQFLILKENVEDAQATSFDGTLTWKITNFQEKRMDAISERKISIYSPSFYSSQTDYKMCLQLCLNGDTNTQGTHMSLFLVLMQDNHNTIFHWPFKFNVTFTLLNQLSSNNNQSISFWFNTTSSCFQHSTTDINIVDGTSTFLSLDLFEKNQNQYVQNDTMFIKVEIDFQAEKPSKLSILKHI